MLTSPWHLRAVRAAPVCCGGLRLRPRAWLSTDAHQSGPVGAGAAAVTSFADLRPHIKRLVRRVHPDAVHSQEGSARTHNNASLLALNDLLDGVRERADVCGVAHKVAPHLRTLGDTHHLRFFWVDTGGGTDTLRELVYTARVPPSLESQTRLVVSRGVASPRLVSEWLHIALTHVKGLLRGIGLPCNAYVARAVAEGGGGRRGRARLFQQPPNVVGADTLLRQNLVEWSPLQQGKVEAFPSPKPLAVGGSVFTHRQRAHRVATLYRRGVFSADPAAPPPAAQSALAAFTEHLVNYFDRSLAYHDVWFSLRVRLCAAAYHYVPETRTLYIPAPFTADALAEFLDEHLPSAIDDALGRVKSSVNWVL